ncbi:hypothetical protein [Synoicihabitans lomoniglobus]|uniref:MFS transporter n=1 Tax=Synoicihabitans lomoniglobus TaxID=2909285 RepID=A0AAE9ZU02_9BACT|nr:hypothetical protein [Opitutaceae bacterium LMO-M01]WED63039.1 hypothetical protein PXH66_11910 [Opitutaceae bacterium LMO-M01]
MISRLIPTEKSDPELAPFRPGLLFGFFNAMTWQIGIGTPMVLFAEELGASSLQVGLAYSFVFILTPIQILATALLPKFGYKKVMLGGWAARSLFLIVPVWLAIAAAHSGVKPWMAPALVGSVFWFCFFRTIGAAAIMPWLYSILPPKARGRYFASDQFISGFAGVGTLLACVALFAQLPIFVALLIQYGIALAGSYLSFMSLRRLPDAPNPEPIGLGRVFRDTPRYMFRPSRFRQFLWLAVGYAVVSTPIPPFLAYYLKVGPALSAGQIMGFEVLRYAGVIAAAAFIKRRISQHGARPFFLLAMILYVMVAAFWWAFIHREWTMLGGVYVAYFGLGLAAACWTISNLNYLAQVIEDDNRALMIAVQGAVTACVGGLSPILWGMALKSQNAAGGPAIDSTMFQVFFGVVIVGVVVLSSLVGRLPEDETQPAKSLVIGNAIFRPFRAATYLVSLVDLRELEKNPPGPEAEPSKGSR